ncbi:MAG: Ig-like domain-containing protein, partial [Ignavibacteriales bacterium]|nr:Ig-like domain-containing protein [Ignavibacteriales bacterium]
MKIKYFLVVVIFSISSILGQNLNSKKIYINPGHGGHDSNDRFIEATGFWESEGNLTKGLYLRKLLDSTNAITAISRTTNYTADDKPLSTIVAEANTFGADYFHSIHSNGYNGQANYTLVIFRGYDSAPDNPQSKIIGQYIVDELYIVNKVTAKYNRGDMSFLGYHLGVLSGLTMTGTLSEGSFHDYIPESWRLQNLDYRENEANAISRGIYKYFSAGDKPVGEIVGIVRDPQFTVPYYYITSLGDDKAPINFINVTVQPGNHLYQGDNMNNGYFIIDSLTPGTYQVYYELEGYSNDSSTVTVVANQTKWASKNLSLDPAYPPKVISHTPVYSSDSVRVDDRTITLYFSRKMDKNNTENAFNTNPPTTGTFSWSDYDTKMTFTPDSFYQSSTVYTVSLDTTATSYWGANLDSVYNFNFVTKSKNGFALISHYPEESQSNFPIRGQVRLVFNYPVHTGTLSGAVILYDDAKVSTAVTNVEIFEKNGLGYIYFEPSQALNRNTNYSVFLAQKIGDTQLYKLLNDIEFFFTTKGDKYTDGTIIDDMEQIGTWQDP